MELILIALLLINQTTAAPSGELMPIQYLVISQKKFNNRGHHPWNNRRVSFQIINHGKSTITVYGFKFDNEFSPAGYVMDFDEKKGEWLYPTPDNRPITWAETSDLEKNKYILHPGKAISFEAEMSEFQVGKRFKRIIYISYQNINDPIEISSEEFVLK